MENESLKVHMGLRYMYDAIEMNLKYSVIWKWKWNISENESWAKLNQNEARLSSIKLELN